MSLKAFSDWVYNFKNWQGNWIWLPTDFETPNLTAYMRKVVNLSSAPQEAWCVITADNQYILYVNGRIVGQDWVFGGGWSVVKPYNILPFLKAGDNIISVEAYNYLGPGALFFESKIKGKDYSTQILSDESWLSSKVKEEKWTNLNFNDSKWEKTKIYGKPPGPPWGGDLIIAPLRQEK